MYSAFLMAKTGKGIMPVDIHEAYYIVLDTLDKYESAERYPEFTYNGAGSFNVVESNELVRFELNIEGQQIHNVLFSK